MSGAGPKLVLPARAVGATGGDSGRMPPPVADRATDRSAAGPSLPGAAGAGAPAGSVSSGAGAPGSLGADPADAPSACRSGTANRDGSGFDRSEGSIVRNELAVSGSTASG